MSDEPHPPGKLRQRLARSIWRVNHRPTGERDWLRLAASNLILHLHPPRVPARVLRFTYTFGLGGLSILLIVILALTGVMLSFAYTPTPESAYLSVLSLQTEVRYGQLVRNLHHWSGNLLVLVVFLHMLRVFFTGAFRRPREFNWVLGLGLLGLVGLGNFSGYLLPWDQLSYWAVTVMTAILAEIPLIGAPLRDMLLGGAEVGAVTLRNFFSLHLLVIPLGLFSIGIFHIWRVRKDKGSVPRNLDETETPAAEGTRPAQRMVTTLPHLVAVEVVFALVVMALLLGWSMVVDAPLLEAAIPTHPPNPAKAAWYFVGIQELLLHFYPTVGGVIIPGAVAAWLLWLPYAQASAAHHDTGVWFRSRRGRALARLSLGLGVLVTAGLIVLSEFGNLSDLFPGWHRLLSDGLLPLAVILGGLWAYDRLLRRRGASPTERQLAAFTLLLAAFVTLTVVGNLCRGPDWKLVFPWEVFR